MAYRRTVSSNGIVVVSESMPDVRSIALGMWYNVGSRDEHDDQAGLTHFMEHMMFKGTPTRDALAISRDFDRLGAELNAFTAKEYTCYYARFVDEKLPEAFPILADMVVNSSFTQDTIDPERKVVLEEIARTEDTPDDFVYDLFGSALMPGHPLGKPVLGTREAVGSYRHADCAAFHQQHYHKGNLTVAAVGNVDHDALVKLVETSFEGIASGTKEVRPRLAVGARSGFIARQKETEQAHVLYGMPWMPFDDERRYAGAIMSALLGGSMSSRLFQEVREKRGLVYAVYTNAAGYQHLGQFSVYAGTRPENLAQVVDLIRIELAKLVEHGAEADELERTCESICGQLLLGLESTSSRMVRLGRNETMGAPYRSADELEKRYRSITADDVRQVAQEFLEAAPTIAVVSPYSEDQVREKLGIA